MQKSNAQTIEPQPNRFIKFIRRLDEQTRSKVLSLLPTEANQMFKQEHIVAQKDVEKHAYNFEEHGYQAQNTEVDGDRYVVYVRQYYDIPEHDPRIVETLSPLIDDTGEKADGISALKLPENLTPDEVQYELDAREIAWTLLKMMPFFGKIEGTLSERQMYLARRILFYGTFDRMSLHSGHYELRADIRPTPNNKVKQAALRQKGSRGEHMLSADYHEEDKKGYLEQTPHVPVNIKLCEYVYIPHDLRAPITNKTGVVITGSGVQSTKIDAGYMGWLMVTLTSHSGETYRIYHEQTLCEMDYMSVGEVVLRPYAFANMKPTIFKKHIETGDNEE